MTEKEKQEYVDNNPPIEPQDKILSRLGGKYRKAGVIATKFKQKKARAKTKRQRQARKQQRDK